MKQLAPLGTIVAFLALAASQPPGIAARAPLPAYQEILLPASTLAGVVPGPGGLLYGVTYEGGDNNKGTIFSAPTDLSQVTILHSFNGDDGRVPYGELTASGSILYGTTSSGGPFGGGTVFAFDSAAGNLQTLAAFDFGLSRPQRKLLVLGDYLYGSTTSFPSGSSVFRVKKDGSEPVQFLHIFTPEEGLLPGALTLGPGGYLYGPAEFGGEASCYPAPYSGCGTIFRVAPDGSQFNVLYKFNKVLVPDPNPDPDEPPGQIIELPGYTFPQRQLIFSNDGRVYGTTYRGVFSLILPPPPGTAASDFQLHYAVPRAQGSQIFAPPIEGLDGRLYINQYDGGDGLTNGVGSVYSMTKLGTDVQTHHLFNLTSGGQGPYGLMYQDSAGTIYGTTEYSAVPPYHGTLFAIRGFNQAPIARATAPASVAAGAGCLASVQLDGSTSSDPNGDPLTYVWSEGATVIATGVAPTVSLGIGAHTITLKVSDPSGANNSTTVSVTVTSDVTLTYLGPSLLQSSGSNVVQVRASTTGGALAGAAVTVTVNGTPFSATTDGNGNASVDVGPVAGISVTVQITTNGGACGSATTTVTVPVNRWPVANGAASAPNVADASCTASVTLDASASFDLDGDALTYRWSEGATLLSTLKTPTVTLSVGTHQITLAVDDGRGGSATTVVPAEVLGQSMTLDYLGPAQLTVGVSTPVSARLRTTGGVSVAGATIRFTINGITSAAQTDASGVVTANVTAPIVGPATLVISYLGEACQQSAQTNAPVTVLPRPATLVVIKSVINDNGGNAVPSDFTMFVSGVDPSPTSFPGNAAGTVVSINAGPYSVSESQLAAYDSTLSAECAGTIALGETRTCTIVNNDRPTTLRLTKSVRNDNGGTALASAWTLTANGIAFTSGVAQPVAPGNYVLAESVGPPGYTASSWSCVGGVLAGNVVTVATNTAVECSIINDDQPASLTLTKVVVNNNGGAATPANWTLTANLLPFVSGVAQSVNAGVYTLAESGGPGGYAAGPWVCLGGSLAGSTLTLRLGESASCSITNDDQGATLTVIKRVINDSGGTRQASDFIMNVAGLSAVPSSFPGNDGGTVVTIAAGPYNVTESGPPGYDATFSPDCTGTLAVGDNKTCTITNDDRQATLTLTKFVTNNSGGSAVPSDWTLTANGTPFASGAAQPVAPGTYLLAETLGPPGYAAGPWACSGGALTGSSVTVGLGVAVSCSIVNDDQPARLTLVKVVLNDNGGTAAITDWTLSAGGMLFSSGVSKDVNAGVYTLAESVGPPGYAAGSWSCSGGALAGSSLTLKLAEQASCTITNDDQPGRLTVIKTVINDDGRGAAASDFTITVTGNAASPAFFPGSAAGTQVMLNAGAYSVGESGPAGYVASMTGDCAGTMGLGEVKTCTITNNDLPANTAPVAQSQSVTTLEDTPVGIVLTATDVDNNPLTYIATGPANGSLSGAAPNLTYTPNPGYYGPDSFTFKANDGLADSNAATVNITVTPVRADVTISILDAPDPVVVGQPLTYTIRVANLGPAVAPATTVLVTLPVGVGLSAAPATCTGIGALTCPQGLLTAGEQRTFLVEVVPQNAGMISAIANASSSAPDPAPGNNTASADTTVDRSLTSVALISSLNPSVFGQPVTFTATVTGFGPTGTITFRDGALTLGTATLAGGTATLTTAALPAGTRSITASYAGDGNNQPSTSATLTQPVQPAPTTTTLSSTPNPSTPGPSIVFTATVAGPSPTDTVSFYEGATLLGSAPLVGGTATLSLNLGVGSHTIIAVYSGDANHAGSTSAPLTQVVNNALGKTPTVTALASSATPSVVGQPVTFTATVTGLNPTGTVTFSDSNGVLGTAPVVGGLATFTVPGFKRGAHQITASYGGDNNNLASTSAKLKQQVQ